MNTKIVIAGAIIILAGTVLYFVLPAPEAQSPGVPPAEETTFSGAGSFAGLMERGDDIYCTFAATDQVGRSEGVFYYSDGRYRIDATTDIDSVIYESFIRSRDGQVYIWGDTPEGEMAIVIPLDMSEADSSQNSLASSQGSLPIDEDQEVAYECESWNANDTTFAPLTGIEFMDIQATFENMRAAGVLDTFDFDDQALTQ